MIRAIILCSALLVALSGFAKAETNMQTESDLIGKHLLIGITIVDEKDEAVEQIQVHGTIDRIVDDMLDIIRADTGEKFTIPFAPHTIEVASPGEYRLRSTGEVVVNPDYLSTWTVSEGEEGVTDELRQSGFPRSPYPEEVN